MPRLYIILTPPFCPFSSSSTPPLLSIHYVFRTRCISYTVPDLFLPPLFPRRIIRISFRDQIIIANRCKLVSSTRDPSLSLKVFERRREKKKRRKETRNTRALTTFPRILNSFILKKVQRINSKHTNAHNRVRVVGSNYGSPRDTRVARITRVKSSSVSCNDAHHTDTPPLPGGIDLSFPLTPDPLCLLFYLPFPSPPC